MKERLGSLDLLTAKFRHKKTAPSLALLSIAFILLFTSNSFAADSVKVRIDDFSGGMNSYDLASVIQPNQGTLYKNVVLNRKGQLFKRKGQSLWASDVSNTAFKGIGVFNPDVNTSYMVIASGVEVLRETSPSGTWTRANTGYDLTAGKDTEFIQANDLFFVLNGYDNTANYSGVAWDEGSSSTASPPTASTGAWLRNYLFLAGNPANNDWVYFSNNLTPQTFTSTDLFKVNTGDGQPIKKLMPFKNNELIIYKTKSIWILDITGTTPLTNWTLQPISTVIGTESPRTVVNFGNDHWFLSSEPFAVRSLVRTAFDKLLIDMVSMPIQDIFDGTGDTVLNTTQVSKACAIYFDNKYILAIPTGTSTYNDLVVVYDFIAKSWYTIDGWYPATWAILSNDLYYMDALDGRVIKCFTGTTGDMASGPTTTAANEPTQAIIFEYRSKDIDFDNPENYKMPDALDMEFEASGSYTATVYIELDDRGWQEVGTVTLSSTAPTLPADLPIVLSSDGIARKTFQIQKYGEFKKIKVRVTQSGLSQQCNLHSFTGVVTVKPWRRE